VSDPAALAGAADGCDAVLHVAGIEAEAPPDATFQRVNVDGTRFLLDEAERAGVPRFVFVSSLGADRGRSDYHRSKLAAERLVRGFSRSWTIVRPGNVYGPGDEVISSILQMVRLLPAVPVIGDGDHPFQPVWTDDLGRALALAVEREDSAEVLPLAGREVTSMNGILDLLGEITGHRPVRVPVPESLAEMGVSAATSLGLAPQVNRDQLIMLQEGNLITPPEINALTELFDIEPTPLADGLRMLAREQPEVLPGEGVGAVHLQRYRVELEGSRLDAEGVIRLIRTEFAALAPGVMAVGSEPDSDMRLDAGCTLSMDLPLRGTVQVRVEEVDARSVTLATLRGHHLAGLIRFQAQPAEDGGIRVEIISHSQASSWPDELARQAGGTTVQKAAWVTMLEAVVERSGGEAPAGVLVEEEILSEAEAEQVNAWAREIVARRERAEG
jgi:NADH dehydrogenase